MIPFLLLLLPMELIQKNDRVLAGAIRADGAAMAATAT